MRQAAIGGGAKHLAKVNMAGGGQHIQMIDGAFGIGTAIDGIKKAGINPLHDAVGTIIIIAEKWRLIPQLQAQRGVAGQRVGRCH